MSDDVHRTYVALLLAVLDQDDGRAQLLLADGALAVRVAHYAAHNVVASIDPGDHAEMRADIAADLLELAGEGP